MPQTHRAKPPLPAALRQSHRTQPRLQTLTAALRALPAQWRQTHGYSPLMAETFTDPQRFEGTADSNTRS
jgi:hypothetical protein